MHCWLANWHHVLMVGAGYLAFFIVNLILGSISRKYRKVLETNVGDAVFNTFAFAIDWILVPVVNKIIFVFTDKFYRKKVIGQFKEDIHGSYKVKLKDLEHQIRLLEDDRGKLRNERLVKDNTDEAYWAGAKYGFSLAEKNRKKVATSTEHAVKNLNEPQLFILRQVANGNKTVTGLVAAYLEDNGYVKLVWDNEAAGKCHYEMTDAGVQYLRKIDRPYSSRDYTGGRGGDYGGGFDWPLDKLNHSVIVEVPERNNNEIRYPYNRVSRSRKHR
jgi:hypothetical protein